MASTKDVLDHHLKCFDDGDLEGILSDYAPCAVLFTQDGPLRGAHAIRPLFQAMIAEFGKPGAAFRLKRQRLTPTSEGQISPAGAADLGLLLNEFSTEGAALGPSGRDPGDRGQLSPSL